MTTTLHSVCFGAEGTTVIAAGATIVEVEHHTAPVNGTTLHYVTAGERGSPILLVHGFPETWWTFHKLIPLLAAEHRVIAVDLRGFGDSDNAPGDDYSSATVAEDLHQLIALLGLGPVHVSGQDIAGNAVFRLAATYPGAVLSLTAIEMGLSGFGLESFADVAHGGAWHFGALATPGVADFVFKGRVRDYLADMWFPFTTKVLGAVTDADVEEFTRTYSRANAWRGCLGLYSSALTEGEAIRALSAGRTLRAPVLAIDASGNPLTATTMSSAATTPVTPVYFDEVGHHVALEAPSQLATAMVAFVRDAVAA